MLSTYKNNASRSRINCRSTLSNAFITLCCLVFFSSTSYASGNVPVFASEISEDLKTLCAQKVCKSDVLSHSSLKSIIQTLDGADDLLSALGLSQYEILIGSAYILNEDKSTNSSDTNSGHGTLHLEVTTAWRQIPLDDISLNIQTEPSQLIASTAELLQTWFEHVKTANILEAQQIYKVLNASDYTNELQVPANIGEFIKQESAIYRDPMQGSISRYTHPEFDDAIIDVTVFPVSPFTHLKGTESTTNVDENDPLINELYTQQDEIKQLLLSANISDSEFSEINKTTVDVNGVPKTGYKLSILLNGSSVPVYSTQYVFMQHDKIIKVSGNMPESFLHSLVVESLPQIQVPKESDFMKAMRKS